MEPDTLNVILEEADTAEVNDSVDQARHTSY